MREMPMRKYRVAVLLSALCFCLGLPAAAHHNGNTYFDLTAEVVHHDATVIEYVIVNPHGQLVYSIADEVGNEQEWSAELISANNLRRRGLGGEILKPGDKLAIVVGSPSRSGSNATRLTRVEFVNGDVIQAVGPNTGITRGSEQ